MVHGPCRSVNKSALCMRDGKCKKRFPKEFSNTTTTAVDGYSIYRRRESRRSVQLAGTLLDNYWIVLYKPLLLLEYNEHINIEIITTVSAVKYLYKYVHKGHDKATVEIRSGENKCSTLLNVSTRFITI